MDIQDSSAAKNTMHHWSLGLCWVGRKQRTYSGAYRIATRGRLWSLWRKT